MTDSPEKQIVDTTTAAEALRISEHTLDEWADTGIVTPAATGPDGQRSWNLHDLRRQIAAYLEDRDED